MFRLTLLSLIVAHLLLPSVGRAQWQYNGTALSTAANAQLTPTIIWDGAGGAIVTWYDDRNGTDYDIYAQRVNASGVVLWTVDGVALCTAANDQMFPTIASDGAAGAIVTWHDLGTFDIYAQRVDASGAVQWTANGVPLCTAVNGQGLPTIVSDDVGGAIVTWGDLRNGPTDIYAQRVKPSGAVSWMADGVPLCTATADQVYPTIGWDGAGGAIVTWQDYRSGTSYDIYAQRISASGTVQWTANGVALCTAANDQWTPMIVLAGLGEAIVTWQDYRSGTNWDIYAQRISAGAVQWTANGVALCTAANDQVQATIAARGAGGAIVTWQDHRSGTNDDIYAQRVNADGTVPWTANGVALCTATDDQWSPTIVSDGAPGGGGAIVTWFDKRSNFTDWDIYAQRVNAAGAVQWTANGVALCTALADQVQPTIVSDWAHGAIVTWYDFRGDPWDIYAQHVDSLGLTTSPTGARDTPSASVVALTPNYPNPFSAGTTMDLDLAVEADVTVDVFDVAGRRVRELQLGHMRAGSSAVRFDGRNDNGRPLPSGVYLYRFRAAGETITGKMMITR